MIIWTVIQCVNAAAPACLFSQAYLYSREQFCRKVSQFSCFSELHAHAGAAAGRAGAAHA
eukprot:scaffold34050_cov18-Tisochrysis_lutea.AAC.2